VVLTFRHRCRGEVENAKEGIFEVFDDSMITGGG